MLSPFQQRKAERHFEALDTNGDGILTFDDLRLSAERMLAWEQESPGAARSRLDRFDTGLRAWWDHLTVLDRNDDGEISPEEFLKGYERVFRTDSDAYGQAARSGASARFDLGDTNGDGVIDEEEFTALFRISFGMPGPTAAQVFSSFLPDGERTLSKDVYVRHAMEFLTGDDPDSPGSGLLGPLPTPNVNA
ncbi:EF-hand domain-containing protein [Streptomyces aurantiacus]|uniref:Putative calcium-binding protein CML17 n=1 Tax=Streptomyces aurantiacus JA 4570 TaxID=1286094 RepID=S3ZRT1_9ACTN|nr:EF-hand domain-containing protein [Streptomyces aurantiacus]EPH46076.1 putative calcium-binding protein CML17 [Streptomyces aurantiacus JA 4570]